MAGTGPQKFSMSDVKARMGNYASTNYYHVFFTLPDAVNGWIGKYADPSQSQTFTQIACIDASLPGSSLATHEITNDYPGITERHVYRRQFDGRIDFTFAIDRNYTLLRMFEGWMGFIGGEYVGSYKNNERKNGYRVPFPEDYMCENLSILKYEKDQFSKSGSRTVLKYQFINSFPNAISSMPITQGPTDLLAMTVSMDYQKYYVIPLTANSSNPSASTHANPDFDPFSAINSQTVSEEGEATVYDPYGSQTTVYDNGQTVIIGGQEYTTDGALDF